MIDLKELMEDRSSRHPTASSLRLEQVRGKITTRRHRRIATVAACAAVTILLVGGYRLIPALHTAPSPEPAATPSATTNGFSEYASGARLVTSQRASMYERTVSLTWTPATLDIVVAGRCEEPPGVLIAAEIRVNGHLLGSSGSCGGYLSFSWDGPETWTASQVQIGVPSTVTINLTNAYSGDFPNQTPTPVPPDGTVAVAIYERVPFSEYVLPPRPADLKPIQALLPCHAMTPGLPTLRSDPADPLKAMSLTIEWRDFISYQHQSQTPGFLHISVNGVRVRKASWWDFDAHPSGGSWETSSTARFANLPGWVQPKQGEMVTITATPEHLTGAWQLQLAHLTTRQDGCGSA